MRIRIDISQIVYEGTGVGRFTQSLIDSLLEYDKKNRYVFFFSSLRRSLDKNLENKIKSRGHQLIKWKLPPTLLSFINNQIHSKFLSSIIYHLSSDLDWFISSDWIEPPLNIKKTTIVHDLVYLKYPETLASSIVSTQKKRMNWVKKESKIIFADSAATKQDLIDLLNIPEGKIVVNYPGVKVSEPTITQINDTLAKYKLKKPFILTVGKIEPRKNLGRLIEAIKQYNDKAIDLIIVGPKGWSTVKQYNNITIKQSNIKFLGYIDDSDLYSLYSSCLFFIYPSLYEGFGYPIVEAMKLGAPVTCSNTSSMKEIAQDSALLFNPLKIDEMYQCINTLIQDEKLRKELIIKGKERAKKFTWENYINILLNNL